MVPTLPGKFFFFFFLSGPGYVGHSLSKASDWPAEIRQAVQIIENIALAESAAKAQGSSRCDC